MKRFSVLRIAAVAILGLAALHPVLTADEYDRKTVISISQPLEAPGVVLAPGTYVMKLLNSPSNRHIVQIMNDRENQQLALTFAVPAERVRPTGKTVFTMYEGSRGAPPALRTWFYPGDTVGQEFLYPHAQAVRISERANTAVPEVETARNAPITVTPSELAESEAQSKSTDKSTDNDAVLIAKAEPAPEPIPAPEPAAAPEPQQPAAEPQSPPAKSEQSPSEETTAKSDESSLPHTAGEGPLAALTGSLACALALGIWKLRRSRIL